MPIIYHQSSQTFIFIMIQSVIFLKFSKIIILVNFIMESVSMIKNSLTIY